MPRRKEDGHDHLTLHSRLNEQLKLGPFSVTPLFLFLPFLIHTNNGGTISYQFSQRVRISSLCGARLTDRDCRLVKNENIFHEYLQGVRCASISGQPLPLSMQRTLDEAMKLPRWLADPVSP